MSDTAAVYINNPTANQLLKRATEKLKGASRLQHTLNTTGQECSACVAMESAQWDIQCAVREIDAGNL